MYYIYIPILQDMFILACVSKIGFFKWPFDILTYRIKVKKFIVRNYILRTIRCLLYTALKTY